jgi:hypothetical protein
MTFTNRYPADCHYCGTHVPANAGIYDYGTISCTETVHQYAGNAYHYFCLPAYNAKHSTNFATIDEAQQAEWQAQEDATAAARENVRLDLVNGALADYATRANVKSLAQVIIKITGADIAVDALTVDQICDVRNELQKRINRKENKIVLDEYKRDDKCNRCGGAGRADKWIHTGSICYKCGGSGKYFNEKRG